MSSRTITTLSLIVLYWAIADSISPSSILNPRILTCESRRFKNTRLPSLKFKEESNVIFCGDFNASCTYAKPAELANLQIHKKPYNWIIPDNVKTNLSLKSDCAYDRFVVTDSLLPKVTKWAVLPYFKTKAVSDHWPVYIELKY